MTVWHIPESIDITIAHMLPDIMSHPNPMIETNRIASDAVHYLSGYLFRDTVSGKDLERLLDSLRAAARARRVELDDIAHVQLDLLEGRPWAA